MKKNNKTKKHLKCFPSTLIIIYLLIFRFFQGLGISVGSIITQVIIRDCFSGIESNKIFSIVGMEIILSPAIAPFIGGYLTENFGWQSNFICLTIMGIFLFIYVFFGLPEMSKITFENIKLNQKNKSKTNISFFKLTKKCYLINILLLLRY